MGKKSKRLGKGFEYEIRDMLREATGDDSFERVPNSGAYFGGANRTRAETARDGLVEMMSGDLICPPDWRWIVECKNHDDVSFHQLFVGDGCKQVDEFLQQVSVDAETSGREPLLIMKLRRKSTKLSKKIRDALTKAEVPIPQTNSVSLGVLVAERAEFCADISGINHIEYTGPLTEDTCATWRFFDFDKWLEYVKARQ